MTMQFISPDARDVLCGRGISCHQHPGNKFLRQMIDKNLPKYASADSKSDKSTILRDIIRAILANGGRFLKKDSETEFYYEAGMKAARDKVGHCLREAMTERSLKTKPAVIKAAMNLVPKPLPCLSPRSAISEGPCTLLDARSVTPLQSHQMFTYPLESQMTMNLPSIVSDSDLNDVSSREDETCSSENITTVTSNSSVSSSSTPSPDVVDALYELPTEGEWEELILPSGIFAIPEANDWVAV